MLKNKSMFGILKQKGFLNLWLNQILVQLSFNALNFALLIWVFHLTNSNTAVSALLLAVYLPAVVFGLFSGVLIDITDRRKIILAINLLMAMAFFSLIFLKGNLWAILVVTFFINTLGQFYAPAEASAIPLVVKKRELLTANTLFTATLFISFLLGFGISGPLIGNFGIDFIFGLGGVILLIAFALAFKFPTIVNKFDYEGKMILKSVKKRDFGSIGKIGLLEIKKTLQIIQGKLAVFFSIFILAGVQVVIGVLAVLVPAFFERELQIHYTDSSFILVIPLGLGIGLGGFLINKLRNKLPKRVIVGTGILLAGLLFFILGLAPFISPVIKYFPSPKPLPFFYQPPLSAILAGGSFLLGISMVSILVPSQTVLQENTPEETRGKVFSVLAVAMQGLSLLPVLLAGMLADFFGVLPIFMAMGGVVALCGLFGLRPSFYFAKHHLPKRLRNFFGKGHWE
jgi:MFS family permease